MAKIKIFIFLILPLLVFSQAYLEKKEFENLISLYEKKEYEKALTGFKEFLKKYPSSYYLPEVYYYTAILENDYYSAIMSFKELIIKFPEYEKCDEALYRLGKLYFLHNNYTEAIRTFEKLQKDYKKSNFIYGSNYWIGLINLLRGDYKIAINYFDRVLDYNKKDKFYFMALLNKGNAYFELKDYKKAIKIFNEVIELKNRNYLPSAYLGIANSYMELKEYDKAYENYKNILKDFAGSPEYEIAYKKIKFIEENKTIFDKLNVKKIFSLSKPVQEKQEESFWCIRVASLKDKRNANNLRIKIKTEGYDSFMKTVKLGNEEFYRVYVGKFSSKEEAEKLRSDLEIKLKIKDVIIEKVKLD